MATPWLAGLHLLAAHPIRCSSPSREPRNAFARLSSCGVLLASNKCAIQRSGRRSFEDLVHAFFLGAVSPRFMTTSTSWMASAGSQLLLCPPMRKRRFVHQMAAHSWTTLSGKNSGRCARVFIRFFGQSSLFALVVHSVRTKRLAMRGLCLDVVSDGLQKPVECDPPKSPR